MTFRERMRSADPPAEYQVLEELLKLGLGKYLESSVAKGGHEIKFIFQIDGCHGTVPDYYWSPPVNLATYLDGKPHLKRETRDLLIDAALTRYGYNFVRFPYNSPISQQRKKEVAWQTRQEILKLYPRYYG